MTRKTPIFAKYYFEVLQRKNCGLKFAYLTSPCPLQRGISPFGGGRGRFGLACFKININLQHDIKKP
jgi:hypothetical protein